MSPDLRMGDVPSFPSILNNCVASSLLASAASFVGMHRALPAFLLGACCVVIPEKSFKMPRERTDGAGHSAWEIVGLI